MKNKTVMSNFFYNSLYRIFVVIIPLIITPYLARVLLPEYLGINSYVNTVITLFTTIGLLGLSGYSIREIAYVRHDKEQLSKTFWELLILRIIFFVITLIILIIYSMNSKYEVYFNIQIITLVYTFLDISWLYMGLEEFKYIFTKNIFIKILTIISIFIFIKSPSDLANLMWIYGIYGALGGLILYFGLNKLVTKYPLKKLEIWKHFIPNLKLFLPQAASLVYLQIDKIMIETITDNVALVGFYNKSEQIIKIPLTLITSLSTVLLPKISAMYKQDNKEDIKKYIHLSVRFSLMLSIPLMFGIMAIAKSMVPWFLGDKYLAVTSILIMLCPTIIFISLSSISGNQYLVAINKTRVLTVSYVISAVINLIVNYFCIKYYGAIGAAMGTIVAEFLVLIIQYYYMKDVIVFKDIVKYSYKYFIYGMIMFVGCYSINFIMKPMIITTLVQVIIGIIIYIGLLLVFKDDMLKSYLNRIVIGLKKKVKGNK